MSYVVIVPEPIQDEISAWGLRIDIEDDFYAALDELQTGHHEKCMRLAAPSPTFVYEFSLQDPLILGITHYFTVWLTYGERDDGLYVRQCDHKEEEKWDS